MAAENRPRSEGMNSKPRIEQRAQLLRPDEFGNSLIWRRQKYSKLATVSSPEAQAERAMLASEIAALSARRKVLRGDEIAANQEEVHKRLADVQRERRGIDPTDAGSKYVQGGLKIREEVLRQRSEQLRSSGPVIRSFDKGEWKAEHHHGGKALPLSQWEQLSPRLKNNPDATLREADEYKWYLESLSPQRRAEVRSLQEQMKPIGDQVRAVVCMPAHKEGANIYKTLENYAGLTEQNGAPFDYNKLRIVIFNNSPEGTRPDQTGSEVRRFMKDHPEVPVDYIKAVLDPSVVKIANIRNIATAAVIGNASENRRNPAGDLVYVSNDADIPPNGIRKTYVADIVREFDTHLQMDALAGKIDFPEDVMDQVPVQLATRRLWQYKDMVHMHKQSREPFLVGRNSAMRLKMIAAVGNYDSRDGAGEDVEIGNKIKWVRRWDAARGRFDKSRTIGGKHQEGNRIRYVHKIALDSDPRRDLVRILGGERIGNQYSVFEKDQSVRGKTGSELAAIAASTGFGEFDRTLFEKEAASFYWDAKGWEKYGGVEAFDKAMGLLGAKYTIEKKVTDGKTTELFRLTNTSSLEKGLQEHRFRHAYQQKFEGFLGTKLRGVEAIRAGSNNLVYSVQTAEGNNLIIRMSRQMRKDKFETEKNVIDLLARHRLPVARVVGVDTEGVVIDGWSFSVSERLPGRSLQGDKNRGERVPDTLLFQAGRAIRKIHDIPVSKGFGILNAKLEGYKSTWSDYVLTPVKMESAQLFIDRGLLSASDVDAALRLMSDKKKLLGSSAQQLLHGDFSLGNLLANGEGRISGVLDLENASSGDPLWDFAGFRVYTADSTIGAKGMDVVLAGYGKPDMLSSREAWEKFNMYRVARIFSALEWHKSQKWSPNSIQWLDLQLKSALSDIKQSPPKPAHLSRSSLSESGSLTEEVAIRPMSKGSVNELLRERFTGAVEWFRDFYEKGTAVSDQEYATGREKYHEIRPQIDAALMTGDAKSKDRLFRAMRKDKSVSLSDKELRRQIDRLASEYKLQSKLFGRPDLRNPAYRFLVYARNRGRLARYERSYAHLPEEINFQQIVHDVAWRKTARGETIKILDEGGTFDLGIQQLAEGIKESIPSSDLQLSSISADDLAIKFSDCHRYPVTHKMADVHKLSDVFEGEKQTLIVSEAAYKFFWDPMGAIRETANMLEQGGWAFLGDIQENVSYNFDSLFVDESGKPQNPVEVFQKLNDLNLGYRFYPSMNITESMGDKRRVMTLAIRKDTADDLIPPVFYAKRQKAPGESAWISPISYVIPQDADAFKARGFTQVS